MARKGSVAPLTREQRAQLKILGEALKAEREAATVARKARREENWQRVYKTKKQLISLRVDADVMVWLKKDGKGYQTRANQVLRERMLKDVEGRK